LVGIAVCGFFFAKVIFAPRVGKSSVTVLVEETRSGRSLVGLLVEADGVPAETDDGGRATFTDLGAGLVTFRVGLPGFKDFYQTVTLKHGDKEELVFSLDVETAGVRGRVLDRASGSPVSEAVVTIGGVRGETDSEGRFSFDKVIIGTPALEVAREGYQTLMTSVTLEGSAAADLGDLSLDRNQKLYGGDGNGK